MNILYALESIRFPALSALMAAVTHLGSETAFIVIAVVVFWCFDKTNGYYLMATGMLGTAINQFVKILCLVPRPWVRDPAFTIVESARADATGYSFPSGHTQSAFSIIGGIARFTKRKAVRIVCIVLVALVAFSRMYLGVHYPTDVGFGLVCGAALVFGLYPVFEKSAEKPQLPVIVFGVTAALSLAAALFVEFRAWPEDIDTANLAEAVKVLNMMFGCSLALAVSIPIERKRIGFETAAPWWAQILKVVLGLACVMALRAGLKPLLTAIFGTFGIASAIRYGLIILFAVLVWPLTFPWFQNGCRLKKEKRA